MGFLAALGSIASAVGSIASPIVQATSRISPSSTTHQAKLNLKYGKLYDTWAAQNMPTLNRQGMEAAGFNPILAINSGEAAHGFSGVSGHSGMSGIQSDLGDIGSAAGAYLDLKNKEQMLDNLQSQKAMFDSTTRLNDTKSGLTVAQTRNTDADTLNKSGLHSKNGWELGSKVFDRLFRGGYFRALPPDAVQRPYLPPAPSTFGDTSSASGSYRSWSDFAPRDSRLRLDTAPRQRYRVETPSLDEVRRKARDDAFERARFWDYHMRNPFNW